MAMTEAQLRDALSQQAGTPVDLTLTRNLRRWVSIQRGKGGIKARLHEVLLDAPQNVLTAVIAFVSHGGMEHGRIIRDHLRHATTDAPRRPPTIRPAGRHHHLGSMLTQMARHFSNARLPLITWGVRRKPGKKNVRLGSYDPKQDIIRINPVLDHPDVPPAMLRYVIFHEMVHHQLEPDRPTHEPQHGSRFFALERTCPDYGAAQDWQKHHLSAHLSHARRVYRQRIH